MLVGAARLCSVSVPVSALGFASVTLPELLSHRLSVPPPAPLATFVVTAAALAIRRVCDVPPAAAPDTVFEIVTLPPATRHSCEPPSVTLSC